MRLIDADELKEHVYRDRLDSREQIANLIDSMPPVQPEHTMRCKYCDMSICTLEDKPCSGKVMVKE